MQRDFAALLDEFRIGVSAGPVAASLIEKKTHSAMEFYMYRTLTRRVVCKRAVDGLKPTARQGRN